MRTTTPTQGKPSSCPSQLVMLLAVGAGLMITGCAGESVQTQTVTELVTVSAPGPTVTATVTAPPSTSPTFEPNCGTTSGPERYLAGVWQADLGGGEARQLIFTPECNVRYDMDPPEGEWTQVGNEVKFVLVSTLDDVIGNEYRGKFISDTTIMGRSENGPFTLTREP